MMHRSAAPASQKAQVRHGSHPITVVIPCLNEALAIEATVERLFSTASIASPEVIVVDGGSKDATLRVISSLELRYRTLRVLASPVPSRGKQMSMGAKIAASASRLVLFLHADTLLPAAWDQAIVEADARHPTLMLGCFRLALPEPIDSKLRIMLLVANLRASWARLPYGDQAYFVRSQELDRIGGIDETLPMMEDVDLLARYQRAAKSKAKRCSLLREEDSLCILNLPVITSPRRWKKKGVWRNTLLNQVYMLAWWAGVSPRTIYAWYYR